MACTKYHDYRAFVPCDIMVNRLIKEIPYMRISKNDKKAIRLMIKQYEIIEIEEGNNEIHTGMGTHVIVQVPFIIIRYRRFGSTSEDCMFEWKFKLER